MQLTRQFNNAIQLITQLSLKSLLIQVSHQSLTVTQLIQCTWYIKPLKLIVLALQVQSLRNVQSLQINLQTTVWGWVVGPGYGV